MGSMPKDMHISDADKVLLRSFFEINADVIMQLDFEEYRNLEELINKLKSYMKRTSSLENKSLLSFLRELINQVNIIKTREVKNTQNKVTSYIKKSYHPTLSDSAISNSVIVNRWAYLSGYRPIKSIDQKLNNGIQRTMLNS